MPKVILCQLGEWSSAVIGITRGFVLDSFRSLSCCMLSS